MKQVKKTALVAIPLLLLVVLVLVFLGQGTDSEPPQKASEPALAPQANVRGRVVDAESGRGVPDVRVFDMESEVSTDAEGWFEWPKVLTPVAVSARKEGWFDAGGELTDVRPFVLRLAQKVHVSGRVVRGTKPVEGAALRWVTEDGTTLDLHGSSGPDGRFTVELRPGQGHLVAVKDGVMADSRVFRGRGGVNVDSVEIDLMERSDLLVTVKGPDGNVVRGARVETVGQRGRRPVSATSDKAGFAALRSIPAQSVRVRVSAPEFSTLVSEVVMLNPDAPTEVTLTLEQLQGVRGVVKRRSGTLVKHAMVYLRPVGQPGSLTSKYARDGGFEFGGLDHGEYEVAATHSHHGQSEWVRVATEDRKDVELVLPEGGSLSGRVVDEGYQPVTHFTVVIKSFEPDFELSEGQDPVRNARTFRRQVVDSDAGEFQISPLAPGKYVVVADAPDFGMGESRQVEVRAEADSSGVEIQLGGGMTISGRVVDAATSEPVGGAGVTMHDAQRQTQRVGPRRTRTDDAGNFVIGGVQDGRRSVQVFKKGYRTYIAAGLEVSGDKDVEIRLEPLAEGEKPKIEFYGVGAVLERTQGGGIRIKSTLDEGPGAMFGLQKGDEIVAVDGQEVGGMNLTHAVDLIRGEEGTTVRIQVRRGDDPEPFEVSVDRGRVSYEQKNRRRPRRRN